LSLSLCRLPLVDESIMALARVRNVGEVWKTVSPGITDASVIGIKVNCASLKTPTCPEVVCCTANGLAQSVSNSTGLEHTNGCSPAIPSLNQQIRDVLEPKEIQKLFIVDGLFGMYSGGPGGPPNFNPKLILMSQDTVACDTQGQNVINAERVLHGLNPLDAAHIRTTAEPPYELGTTELNLIELNNVGVGEAGRPVSGDGRRRLFPAAQPRRRHPGAKGPRRRLGSVSLPSSRAAARMGRQGPWALEHAALGCP